MKRFILVFATILISGCAAKTLLPGAERVFLSNDAPPGNCEFIQEVHGGQGNWWTDDITSTKALTEGSRNDLRNAAYRVGANYVHIQQQERNESYLGGGKIALAGNAYSCEK